MIFVAEKTSQMQDVLKDMTGQRTVPNVFINKQHVGGCTDTEQALSDGTLFDRLEGTFNTYDYDYIVIGGGSGGLASAKVCDFCTLTEAMFPFNKSNVGFVLE